STRRETATRWSRWISPWSSCTSSIRPATSSWSWCRLRPSRKLRTARKRSGKVATMLNVPLSTTNTSSTGPDGSELPLLARIRGSSGTPGRKELLEPLRDGSRHEGGDVAAGRGDRLDAARRDEAHRRARDRVDGLDVG